MPEDAKAKEQIAGGWRTKAGGAAAIALLVIALAVALPLLRAEVKGVSVALSVAGQSAGARHRAVGGALYLTTAEVARLMPKAGLISSAGRLHLLTLPQAFGSVGSKVRYALYPRGVSVEEFGLPFVAGTVVKGDYILIYIPAPALKSRRNVEAVAGIEAAMVRGYGLVRLFANRFSAADGGAGAYSALYAVGGAADTVKPPASGTGNGKKSGVTSRGTVT